jgi:hypothetical protein
MTVKTPTDILGTEYDWLATDEDGHVAMFSTAGGGFAPATFLRDTDAHDAAIRALIAVPPSSELALSTGLTPRVDDMWDELAKRGVYAYDSSYSGGPYELIAAPATPVNVDELPKEIAAIAKRIRIPGIRFGSVTTLHCGELRRLTQ